MTDDNDRPLRVTHIEAVNFMGIRALTIDPGDETFVQIVGPNASGKTSGLNALVTALSPKRQHPEVPLRAGEDKGHVGVELSDDLKPRYRAEWHWEKGKKDGTLKLWSLKGDRQVPLKRGRSVLDELLGDIGLDPLAFQHADPKDQVAMLMSASGLVDFYEESQGTRDGLFEARTEVNREAKRLGNLVESTPDPAPGKDLEEISDKALAEKMQDAHIHNREHSNLETLITSDTSSITEAKCEIERLQRNIELYESRLVGARDELAELGPLIDAIVLQTQLSECREHNEQCQQQADHREHLMELTGAETEAEKLTSDIAAIDVDIIKQLDESDLGKNIPGLKIADGEVSLNGVPLKQVCGWEGLHISTLVCMAANPRARVLKIDEADRIDKDSMNKLCDLADEREFQIFMACVRTTMDDDPDTHVCRLKDGEQVT